GAFAAWNYFPINDSNTVGFLVHGSISQNNFGMTRGIATKMNQNSSFDPQNQGYVTVDSSWVNLTRQGKNAKVFDWQVDTPNGSGLQAFGRLLSSSNRFALCMAKRVFNEVCARDQSPYSDVKNEVTEQLAKSFQEKNYNLRELFVDAALHPKCQVK
ncbi:MAG: hypothetical protein NZ480_04715, partial [Bdellovibrionaceae bacterium]|nr:hypothetical protein [Pseudobdellovibrionaceae bacterium]